VRTKGANSSDVLSQLGSAPERVVEISAPRPARRAAPPPRAAPAPVVAAPEKPDSLTVTVFRGTDVQRQKFEKPTAPKTSPQN
jgi:hypothetical protein